MCFTNSSKGTFVSSLEKQTLVCGSLCVCSFTSAVQRPGTHSQSSTESDAHTKIRGTKHKKTQRTKTREFLLHLQIGKMQLQPSQDTPNDSWFLLERTKGKRKMGKRINWKRKRTDKRRRKTNKNVKNGKEWCTVNVEKKWGWTDR